MSDTLKATQAGLQAVDLARQQRRWNKQSVAWCEAAGVSQATLKRFWRRLPIQTEAFHAICEAVRVDWEKVIKQLVPHDTISPWKSDVNFWVGRDDQLQTLLERLQGDCRVLALVGITGIGKTALATQLCDRLQNLMPEQQIITIHFDHPGRTEFETVAKYLLGDSMQIQAAGNCISTDETVQQVVTCLIHQPIVLVLDGLEAVLQGDAEKGWSKFQDPVWGRWLQQMMAADVCLGKVIMTSQDFPVELETIGQRYLDIWHCEVVQGISREERLSLFSLAGLDPFQSMQSQSYLERIGAAYEGHPLALRVVAGEMLGHPFCGDVLAYWNAYGLEIEALEDLQREADCQGQKDSLSLDRYTRHLHRAVRQRIEKTFQRLRQEVPHGYLLLCFGSVYRRPVLRKFWLKMLAPLKLNEEQCRFMLDALRDRYLIEDIIVNHELCVRQHNLIRSVALNHLQHLQAEFVQGYMPK